MQALDTCTLSYALCMQLKCWQRIKSNQAAPKVFCGSAGSRSAVYTKLWSAAALANGVGPLLATIVFVATGNVWTRHALEARLRLLDSQPTCVVHKPNAHELLVAAPMPQSTAIHCTQASHVTRRPPVPHTSQIVIYAGMALSLVPAFTLQFFDDSKFLGPESDAILSAVPSAGRADHYGHPHTQLYRRQQGWRRVCSLLLNPSLVTVPD